VVNITRLGYDYDTAPLLEAPPKAVSPHLRISGINRAAISGSFLVSTWAYTPKEKGPMLIGTEPILSRWHVGGCANCQTHLDVNTHLSLESWDRDTVAKSHFTVLVHTRDSPSGEGAPGGAVPVVEVGYPGSQ
jgi:tyrosinase